MSVRKPNFNSIKVRLEPLPSQNGSLSSLFQFHKGTIRTNYFTMSFKNIILFQFHKGTIRTVQNSYDTVDEDDFNSIKVRLEPSQLTKVRHMM